MLRLLPTESERKRATRADHLARCGPGLCTLEHGLAPKEGGFSLVQRAFIAHGASAASAARRARALEAHMLRLLRTESEHSGTQSLHAQATSQSEGQGWHVGARLCTEGGRPLRVQRLSMAHRASAASAARRLRATALTLCWEEVQHVRFRRARAPRHADGTRSTRYGRVLYRREADLHRCMAVLPHASPGPHFARWLARAVRLRASALALSGEEAQHARYLRTRAATRWRQLLHSP